MPAQLPKRVEIREVGPREGFQSFHAVVPTKDKLRLIESLTHSGLQEIEVTSFVRPDRVPQLADAEELVKALPHHQGVRYTALYLNQKGFTRAESSGRLSNRAWLYTSPSDSFLKANSNTTLRQSVASIADWITLFRAHGKQVYAMVISNAFGCAYEGTISAHRVRDVVELYRRSLTGLGESLCEICLADTVGMANPLLIQECIEILRPLGIPISLHLHDTRGLGLTNAYTALQLGVASFESSVGGIGGCPFTPGASGNIASEDLVYLCESLGIETGVNLGALCQAAHLCEEILGEPLPGRVYKTYLKNTQQ